MLHATNIQLSVLEGSLLCKWPEWILCKKNGTQHKLQFSSRLKKSNKMQQYADIYLLLNYCACFGRPSRPSSGVHKTVVAASGTDHTIWEASVFKRDQIRTPYLVMFEDACSLGSMICTRGCNYSFMYSWWWARWTPETCRVI